MSSSKCVRPKLTNSEVNGKLPPVLTDFDRLDPLEVDHLDPLFEGVSRPSRRIRELQRRKRLRHNALVSEMRAELGGLSGEVEHTVCFLTRNIRTELDKAAHMVRLKREEVLEAQAEFGTGASLRSARLKPVLAGAWETVSQLTEQRRRAIDAFYDLLLEVEDGRCNSARASIGKYRDLMARVGHLPPPQLQAFVAKEIKVVSEAHLRNVISFGDLRFCLSRDTERDFLKFRGKFLSARRRCKEKCQRAALSQLQEAANRSLEECLACTAQGRRAERHFRQRMEQLRAHLAWPQPYPFPASSVATWEEGVRSYLRELEHDAESVVSALGEGLTEQAQLCAQEIARLKTVLLDNHLCSPDEFEKIQKRVCQPILEHLKNRQENETIELRSCWKHALTQMLREVEALAEMLRAAGALWDNHCEREKSERDSILQQLEERKGSYGESIKAKERRLNTIISKAKKETEPQALQDITVRINAILDEINSSYQDIHTEGKDIIQGFTMSIQNEQQVLKSEARAYFDGNPRPIEEENAIEKSKDFLGISGQGVRDVVSERIRLWVEIEKFYNARCHDELVFSGEKWKQEVLEKMKQEYMCQHEALTSRKDELYQQVQKARLAELEEHKMLLNTRSEEIKTSMEKLRTELENIFQEEFNMFNQMSINLKKFREDGLIQTEWSSLQEIMLKTEEEFNKTENNINNLEVEFEEYVKHELHHVCDGNTKFMSSLKSFSEGGSFAESELTQFCAKLEILKNELTSQGEHHYKTLTSRSKQCCKQAQKYYEKCQKDLQHHLEYLIFSRDVTILIQKVQVNIRKQTFNLKNGGKLLQQQMEQIKRQSIDIKNEMNLFKRWRCILENALQRQELLLGLLSKHEIHTETNYENSWHLIPYVREGKCFLSTVFFYLKDSLHNVEDIVKKFYDLRVDQGILASDVILDQVHLFMRDVETKYRHYQVQCFDIWMSELKEYLDMILNLKEQAKRLILAAANMHHEALVLKIEEKDEELRIKIDQLTKYHRNIQMELMAKLSPLHGFPYNRQSLESLSLDFDASFKKLSLSIDEAISTYCEALKQYQDEYKNEFKNTRDILLEILEKILVKQLILSLAQKVGAESKYLNHLSSHFMHGTFDRHNTGQTGSDEKEYREFQLNAVIFQKFREYAELLDDVASKLTTKGHEQDNTQSDLCEISSLLEGMESNIKSAEFLLKTKGNEMRESMRKHHEVDQDLRHKWRKGLESIKQLHKCYD